MAFKAGVIKSPIPLNSIVCAPAEYVGQAFGDPPGPVQDFKTESKNGHAAPEPDAAAHHILGELYEQFMPAPAGFGLFNPHVFGASRTRRFVCYFQS